MKKCLIVVDFQNDFIDGALGFDGAMDIKNNIVEKIKNYQLENQDIIYTMDTHQNDYMDSEEGKNLPVIHCVEGTHGHEIQQDVKALKNDNDKTFIKPTFPSLELGEYLKDQAYEVVELCGLVSNICVLSNAVIAKSALPNAHIVVDAQATASFDPDLHQKVIGYHGRHPCRSDKPMNVLNETMLIDFYELTMANGYFNSDKRDQIVYFDLYFRSIPDRGGYALFAGLETIIDYIDNLRFTDEDISYLRSKNTFSETFLEYLRNFKFTGDLYAFKEGSVMFANEPIITVKAPIIEAQILETFLLQTVNHQSLIATKASRIKYAADGRLVLEMGARRAHGLSSSLHGARASYIGGVDGTSNVLADQVYGVNAIGTMAHSWVQLFDSEYGAFKTYAMQYPNAATLLVDTYDTLRSGIPNAIKVIKEVLLPQKAKNYAIRIDSGDLTYLSKKARKMLDDEGLDDCKIVVSNALDERLIRGLLLQGAPIDIFGVGERLITAKSDPVFGSVYKLVAIEENGIIIPKIKISDNVEKITTPQFKTVHRIYGEEGRAEADLITLDSEKINSSKPLTIFDPQNTWKTKTFTKYQLRNMHVPIFLKGKRVYDKPSIEEIREYAKSELNSLWEEMRRFDYPHKYYIDLSKKLWKIKHDLIEKR